MVEPRPTKSGLAFMLRALGSRNFRLFFGGQIVSLVGTWLSFVATSWLVYRLAREADARAALMLGLVGFAGQLPSLVLAPLAGVLVDRWNKHRILVWTQTLAMLQSFALAALTLADVITIPQLAALAMVQGLINAIDLPARQAFLVEMVDSRDDLSNAIALNSSMFHGARMVGPAVAGYLIYAVGEGYCFLIDGFSYLAVIGSLVAMRLPPRPAPHAPQHPLTALREGFKYAYGFRPIRVLITLVAVISLSMMSQATLMPIVAAEILHGDELTLGWLSCSLGAGALIGTLYLAARRSVVGLSRVIVATTATFGVGMILFSTSRALAISMPLLAVNGAAMVISMAAANTMVQTLVDDDKRGRVMALFTMAFFGMAPIGSLLSGTIASVLGAPYTLAMAGGLAILASIMFAASLPRLRPLVRPIYEAKGILPARDGSASARRTAEPLAGDGESGAATGAAHLPS